MPQVPPPHAIVRSASAPGSKVTDLGGSSYFLCSERTWLMSDLSTAGALAASEPPDRRSPSIGPGGATAGAPRPAGAWPGPSGASRSLGRKSSSKCVLASGGGVFQEVKEMSNSSTRFIVSTKSRGSLWPPGAESTPRSITDLEGEFNATVTAKTDSPVGSPISGWFNTSFRMPGSLTTGARSSLRSPERLRMTSTVGSRVATLQKRKSSVSCAAPALLLGPRMPQWAFPRSLSLLLLRFLLSPRPRHLEPCLLCSFGAAPGLGGDSASVFWGFHSMASICVP
mmetsp:Transcript_107493/g.336247  ORF Transcript_107493/g.336247 Transcript_107493/m.336247 type:complete len:283 (+) Transcript_107493:301-1149(+)